MTEMEGKRLAERLTRVWKPTNFELKINLDSAAQSDSVGDFTYLGQMEAGAAISVVFDAVWSIIGVEYEFCLGGTSLFCEHGHCYAHTSLRHRIENWQEREQTFAAQ